MILGSLAVERDSFFRYTLLVFTFCFFSLSVWGQGIQGIILESFLHHPVPNATIRISFGDDNEFLCTSNELGEFMWQNEKAGRAIIEITADGYTPFFETDVLFDGYTMRNKSYKLEKTAFNLESITVVASQFSTTPFVRTITPDDALRIAGNFEDPVRIAHSQPGIVLLNDQANHLSARGQAPIFNSWYLEGLKIVNPNHTSNAGTVSDLPTQYGGGINMFSAQTLGSTDVHVGVNPLNINTNSGAAIDMHLHESGKPEWRAKAGLLGFELGGGATTGEKSILDFNLRYSFTGVLTNLGADFGGEKINYYDGVVSFRNEGANHKLKLFAFAGRSINLFDHAASPEEIESYKDLFDIDYDNDIYGAGGRYDLSISPSLFFRSGIAYSKNISSYEKKGPYNTTPELFERDYSIAITSVFAEISFLPTRHFQSNFGVDITDKKYLLGNEQSSLNESNVAQRAYLLTTWRFNPELAIDAGAELLHDNERSDWIPGYRFQLNWNTSQKNLLFAGLRHGASDPFYSFANTLSYVGLISQTYEAGWKYSNNIQHFGLNLYFQQMNQLEVYSGSAGFPNHEFLADYPNSGNAQFLERSNNGYSHHMGIEGQWDIQTQSGWTAMINQSVYRSERGIKKESGETGRYNGEFTTHFSIAREFLKSSQGKNKFWNLSLRGIFNGGLREPVIDTQGNLPPQYQSPVIYNQKLPNYVRLDCGITRTIARAKVRWRYALDIQNVFGFTNVAYHYFDPYLNSVVPQNQLGLIPVLSVQASW